MSKYFTDVQMSCKCGCGYIVHNPEQEMLMDRIAETAMDRYGVCPTITSWARCEEHNEREGGTKNSFHVQGIATDWHLGDAADVDEMVELADNCLADGIGAYYAKGFCHTDSRGYEAYWEE
jgi:uncharacterized protein YcbK (DUF882 family)